jgi:hypothetical protein
MPQPITLPRAPNKNEEKYDYEGLEEELQQQKKTKVT